MSDYDEDMDFDGHNARDERNDQASRRGKERARHEEEEEDEEQNEEEYDEEEDEDEEEEEEEDVGRKGKKRQKHRHKRNPLNRFIDFEAEVSDDDEEEDEEDEGAEAFIDTFDDEEVNEDLSRRHHAILDNRRHFDEEDKSPEQIAKAFQDRYRGRATPRYTGDLNEVPQRLLMPSVHDASLWQVRVKAGREREIIFSLMRKSIDMEYTANPLSILSAFQRDSLPGMIYVEARSAKVVQQACNGLVGVYLSRGIHLVPIDEMASLLKIKKTDQTINPGAWVRIRRGKYQGDIAQVIDVNDDDVGLRLIPRIDLSPHEEAPSSSSQDPTKKRKKGAVSNASRPPQKLFNYEEVAKVWGRKNVSRKNNAFMFQGDDYVNGFLEKDFKLSAVILEENAPTLDEITLFMRRSDGGEGGESMVDLSAIAEAAKKAAIAVLQPGDHIEVFEGEQIGIHGIVDEISGDVVTITAVGADIEGQKVELPARSVRKRFKPGDHVKVMQGQNTDETGLVVSVTDNIVTFISDMSMQEVSVFSKDLREAAEVGTSTNTVGNYELHDLVQLDAQTVGVIFKTERDSFRVLDQNGQVRIVQPHQISMRKDSSRAIAADAEGHELRVNDNVKEVDGEQRKGRVLHTYQSFFAFLHNRDITEHGGVFVTRARSLVSLAPKGNALKAGMDLSKMNPNLAVPAGGMVGSGAMGRGPRDRNIGLRVTVVKGPHKGYVGTIKDANGNLYRVELLTGNRVITIDKDKLMKTGTDKKLYPLHAAIASAGMNTNTGGGNWGAPPAWPASAASGGRTPFGGSSKTPNPYAAGDGRTPAWNASSRTPNPYADGGKTPAWNASSRTPNPYADGGRTPAWNVSSRTPNPYATGANAGASHSGWGGATPGRSWGDSNAQSSWTGGDGFSSPRNTNTWGDSWSAPTPAAAATPAFGQTPAYAPTPGVAQTPAGVFHSAGSSATPAASGGYALNDHNPDTLDPDWLFDPAVVPHHPRIKIKMVGTQLTQYLGGEYEGRRGKVIAGTKAPQGYEQTATVLFESGEQRSVVARYISPVPPTHNNEEVLIAGGKYLGQVMVVREDPDDETVTVSSRANPAAVVAVPKELLVALYDESA